MARALDLVGHKYGRLMVVRRLGKRPAGCSTVVYWECRCDCSRSVVVGTGSLRTGNTRSCGCLKRDLQGHNWRTHGKTGSRAHRVWKGLFGRCRNPRDRAYHHYGGRGIYVCDRWLLFENFYADMGDPPDGLELDRIDNDGPYSPDNCRWTSRSEQMKNTRVTHLITFRGETRCLKDWAKSLGMGATSLSERIDKGWPLDRALTIRKFGTKGKGKSRGVRI